MAVIWNAENAARESINAWTHGIGFAASLPALWFMATLAARYHADMWYACIVYGITLSAMYLFSTLSHAVREPYWRNRARAWDQGAVYLLIAGTYTPFIYAYLSSAQRVVLLLLVWGTAAMGYYSKVIAGHRLNNMTSVTYVLLGWIPAMWLLFYVTPICFGTMTLGGVLYTVGTRFLQNDHRRWYFHAVWHLLVIIASACHYVAILVFPILNLDR